MGRIMIVVVYVLAMVGVGYWAMKKTRNVGDFFLGGRTIGPWMSAFAYGTTYFSGGRVHRLRGKARLGVRHSHDVDSPGQHDRGKPAGTGAYSARDAHHDSQAKCTAPCRFLASRYNSQLLKLAAALIIFVFLVPYSRLGLHGPWLSVSEELRYVHLAALAFLAALTGVYLVMGGYFALHHDRFCAGIVGDLRRDDNGSVSCLEGGRFWSRDHCPAQA